jgi:S-adenosylmethionine hydrolase
LHADHFGNLLTSLGQFCQTQTGEWQFTSWTGNTESFSIPLEKAQIRLPRGETLGLAKTFSEIPGGKCAALIGSSGLMEIAANRQSAADLLEYSGGESVIVEYI